MSDPNSKFKDPLFIQAGEIAANVLRNKNYADEDEAIEDERILEHDLWRELQDERWGDRG
jgi:hypothetical protein